MPCMAPSPRAEYNERRMRCEQAAAFFASALDHEVKALRDVSLDEWKRFSLGMDPVAARRAAHIIEENHRVLEARQRLSHGDLGGFGKLMFQSHQSSRENFENSCHELDVIVEQAQNLESVSGARLSGGGFGGSAVMLIHPLDAEAVSRAVADRYKREFGHPCDVRTIKPSDGARVVVQAGT
ncbi:galactokinase [Verrucomicrobiota bacterium]